MRTLGTRILFLVAIILPALGFICKMDYTICETSLIVDYRLTMTHPSKWKVYPYQGKLYQYNVTNHERATPIPTEEVITADGWEEERLVIVANGTLPGPPIIVYEGQRLVVNVINKLHSDTVTIHWHGLPQQGTPWMDGVAFITQCPILPGQSFTYDFIARPKGTYWYHSHVGTQRTKGLYGALVVRDRNDIIAEHNIVVQGWNHHWSADMDQAMFKSDGIYENRVKWKNSFSVDGEFYSTLLLTSAIINGRGRYYSNGITQEHNNAPLSVFKVRQGQKYRFRVINADNLYPFRISVDSHNISLVATDGYDIRPILAESFVIQAGERYDLVLTADQPIKNYWIRARTLEIEADRLHRADAILRYEKAEENEPVSLPQLCSVDSKCLVVNCPFPYFPEDTFIDCLQVDKLEAFDIDDPVPLASDVSFREYFLNFAFPGIEGYGPSSVNGRRFELPPVSALTQPHEIESRCDRTECGEEKVCECTHSLTLDYGDVVQLVLMSMGKGTGGFHPVHLHGYSFYVLKVAFGNYDNTTGHYIGPKIDDINCNGNGSHTTSLCNAAMWRNQSWGGNNIPGLNLLNPPRKDTVLVPAGGYVVIRFKADNPGLWILHCHMQVHNVGGMAILLNSSFDRIPKPPKHFPICHNFPRTSFTEEDKTFTLMSSQKDGHMIKLFWITVTLLSILIIFLAAYIIHFQTKYTCSRADQQRQKMRERRYRM